MDIKQSPNEKTLTELVNTITFYRCNLHRLAEDYILKGSSIKLHLYQTILLNLMNLLPTITTNIIYRVVPQSCILALYFCCRCILYPHSRIITNNKVQKLMPNSYNLRMEIKDIKVGANSTEVIFKNGSSIVVVKSVDYNHIRGNRGNDLINKIKTIEEEFNEY